LLIEEHVSGAVPAAPDSFVPNDRADALQWMRFAGVVLIAGMLWDAWYPAVVIVIYELLSLAAADAHSAVLYALLYVVRDLGYGVIIFTAYHFVMRCRPISDLGIRPFPWWHAVLGVSVGVVMLFANPGLMRMLHLHAGEAVRFDAHMHRYLHGFIAALMFTATALFSPIAQEAFFRGTLLTAFRKWMPLWSAVAFSSMIFALWHHTGGPAQMVDTFVAGIVTSVLYVRTRNLAAPCFAHIVVNAHAELAMLGVLR
jgi:membrane protease YdiL (CAAX protease family)